MKIISMSFRKSSISFFDGGGHQSYSLLGPSINPSRLTATLRMIFLITFIVCQVELDETLIFQLSTLQSKLLHQVDGGFWLHICRSDAKNLVAVSQIKIPFSFSRQVIQAGF